MSETLSTLSYQLVDALPADAQPVAVAALQALQDGDGFGGAFSRLLGVRFTEFGDGRCTATLEVRPHLLSPHGFAQGGVPFTLADLACGGAVLSVLDRPRLVTQDMQIRYHGAARPGQITAAAEVIYHGRRTVTTQGRVTQGELLVASVTATFALLSDAELADLGSQFVRRNG